MRNTPFKNFILKVFSAKKMEHFLSGGVGGKHNACLPAGSCVEWNVSQKTF